MCGCEDLYEVEHLYYELLWAVENKYPDETRHETALRYIKEAENRDSGECKEVEKSD